MQPLERVPSCRSRERETLEEEGRSGIQVKYGNIFSISNFYSCRIFDKDGDGFVSKKEFKWMTANKRISQRKVDVMFEVKQDEKS